MDPSSLPHLAALVTLGDRAAFTFDLKQRSVGVVAGGGSVTFDARFAFVSLVSGWVGDVGRVDERRSTMQTSCR